MSGGMVPMPNPIPYSEIVAYARANAQLVEELVPIMQMLDAVVLAHMRRALASKQGKRPAAEAPARRRGRRRR